MIPDGESPPDRFQLISELGRGQYSTVYKAFDLQDRVFVALKRVNYFDRSVGLPLSFYRELKSLQDLRHPNIINLRDIVRSPDQSTLYMVLDYCDFDLHAVISSRGGSGLPLNQARVIMRQLLIGLSVMHSVGFAHRDIKPANIFVTSENVAKLGDFGLTRKVKKCHNRPLTKTVITPSYRSPEVLLCDDRYGCPVDIWSLACVFFEIATGQMLFLPPTASDIDQLQCIFEKCGTPTSENWPDVEKLPGFAFIADWNRMPSRLSQCLDERLPPEFLGLKNLLEGMLALDPIKRWTAEQILADSFFENEEAIENLPRIRIPESHGRKGRRKWKTRCVMAPIRPVRVFAPPVFG
jgi:serine/threonine protein kinase